MKTKGKKHICKICKRPYFDLGKKVHSCPTCKSNDKNKPIVSKVAKNQKPEKPKDISTEMELFKVTDPSSGQAQGISTGALKINFSEIKIGMQQSSQKLKTKKSRTKMQSFTLMSLH